MRLTNVRVVALDGFEIFEELTTGIEKTSSLLRAPVAFLSDRQRKRCVNCEGAAAYLSQQLGSAFLPFAHARPSAISGSPVPKSIHLDSGRWSSSLGLNYYLAQEQPDRALHKLWSNPGAAGVVIRRAPNGPTRIFDSYRRPSDWCSGESKEGWW